MSDLGPGSYVYIVVRWIGSTYTEAGVVVVVVVVVVSGIKIFPVNHRLTKDTDDGSTIRPTWCSVVFLPAD